MSRIGNTLHMLELSCLTTTPLHVGTGETDAFTDAPCVRSASGQLFVPGTSIAGSLRALTSRLYGEQAADDIFGFLRDKRERSDEEEGSDGVPSAVWVFDALVEKPTTEIRDGVGVDRRTMGPAQGIKFDVEVVPAGTPLTIRVMVESETSEDASQRAAMMRGVLREVAVGRWALGGRTSRGLGWLRLATGAESLAEASHDLTDCEDVVGLALNGMWDGLQVVDALDAAVERAAPRTSGAPMTVSVRLRASVVEPIAVGGRKQTSATDLAPVETQIADDGTTAYVIPGSTLKGALRSRAEEIMRRVGGAGAACDPLARVPDAGFQSCSARIDRDLKRVRSSSRFTEWVDAEACHACRLFGMGHWKSSLNCKDSVIEGCTTKKYDWVAIDRFTGGAAKGKKFDGTLLTSGSFEFEILLMEDRRGGHDDLAHLALVFHLLRDLEMDGLQLGFGKLRGWGHCAVEVREVDLRLGPGSALERIEPLCTPFEDDHSALTAVRFDWQAFCESGGDEARTVREVLDEAFMRYAVTAQEVHS